MLFRNSKIKKANELRLKANRATRTAERLAEKHQKELRGVTDKNKRMKIDDKYARIFRRADIEADVARVNYYHYVHHNFDLDEIQNTTSGKEMRSRKFIESLRRTK